MASRVTRRAARLATVLLLGLSLIWTSASERGDAATLVTLTGYGADSCTAPSESQMRAFWNNTPYSYWGIYIGGSDRACAQPQLTKAWVSDVTKMGWDLLPIWVGPQNPCTPGQASYFSTNTTTAYKQGKAQALAAYRAWRTLSSATNVPIDYDLEASSTDTATCRAAAKAFINGWVAQMHVAPAQAAGVYTSTCAGHLDDFATIANRPNFIDGADWDGVPSTGALSCVATNYWIHHQRHKQYQGGHNVTYNRVTLNVDSRCADAQVYGTSSRVSSTHACALSRSASVAAQTQSAATTAVSWHGTRWQAGGPLDTQLWRASSSTPTSWTPVRLAGLTRATHDVAPTAPTVGRPTPMPDGSLLVPVTSHRGGQQRVTLYTTKDGAHFTRRGRLPVATNLGAGVAAPVALAGSRVIVVDSPAGRVRVWSPAKATSFATSGLPALPESITFSSATVGQAVVEVMSCHGTGKTGCVPQPRIYRTTDGGRTWH